MIKIDYEGAWKELEEYFYEKAKSENRKVQEYNIFSLNHYNMMKNLEKIHTQNVIELKKRSDKEIADYCLKKYTEIYLENINLKKRLKELDKRPIKPERMDHVERGAALGKPRTFNKKEYEKKMDKWFESLSISQQADVAYNFWDGASYEEKKEEYEAE